MKFKVVSEIHINVSMTGRSNDLTLLSLCCSFYFLEQLLFLLCLQIYHNKVVDSSTLVILTTHMMYR